MNDDPPLVPIRESHLGRHLYGADGRCFAVAEDPAYAALICKAVNHHDELVAALRDAVRLMPLGTKTRAEWLGRASDVLKKIDTP